MYLELLITVALAAHLLTVNIASAGPLFAASFWRPSRAAPEAGRWLSTRLTKASFAALIIGSILGAALLAVPSPGLEAALARFPSSMYWYAGSELAFTAICLALMLLLQRKYRIGRWGAWSLALLSSSNLLYHFPPLMAVFGELVADPAWAPSGEIDRPAMLRLWMRPEILALWAHFTLAAIATTAVFALWTIRRQPADEMQADDSAIAARVARRLAAAALIASLVQIPVGVWLVVVSDEATRSSIMGGSLPASAMFLGGLLATFALLQTLVYLAFGDQTTAATRRAAWLLVAIVFLMTGTLRVSRARPDRVGAGAAAHRSAGQGGDYFACAAASAIAASALNSSSIFFSSSVRSFFAASRSPPGSLPCSSNSP